MLQANLSVKANIRLSHVSDIELGKAKIMFATFTPIAEALKISTDVLLRPAIPQVNNLYQNEFAEILGNCTPDGIDAIIKIVKKLKTTMHSNKMYMLFNRLENRFRPVIYFVFYKPRVKHLTRGLFLLSTNINKIFKRLFYFGGNRYE